MQQARWKAITTASWVCVGAYLVLIIITPSVSELSLAQWVRDVANATLAVAIAILSVKYGGILTDFYSKLTGFGITDVRADRMGADPKQTEKWLERIQGSKEVVIVGTLSQGWFVTAHDNLKHLFENNSQPKTLSACLLDPFGKFWRSKIESGEHDHVRFVREAMHVFRNLHELMKLAPERVQVQLYDAEPLSCVIARGAIYMALYLPRTERKEVPEFTISDGSFLGNKVNSESIQKLRSSAPVLKDAAIEAYIKTLEDNLTVSRDVFWSNPAVSCDFCKEVRKLPSELTRRYPALIDGRRMAVEGSYFYVVPTIGPLVANHALFVTRSHLTSSARLEDPGLRELGEIQLKFHAKGNGNDALFFEHGVPSDGNGLGGCGICHCHVHALHVPKAAEITSIADKVDEFLKKRDYKFSRTQIGSWKEVKHFHSDSYLCIQGNLDGPSVFRFVSGRRVESQLMRQFIKEHRNSDLEWDWRNDKGGKDGEAALMSATILLKKMLS